MALRAIRIDGEGGWDAPVVPASDELERPKLLGAGAERDRHARIVAIVAPSACDDAAREPASTRPMHSVRDVYQRETAALLAALMKAANVSSGDVGAAVDLAAQRVRAMKADHRLGLVDIRMMHDRGPQRLRALLAPLVAELDALDALLRGSRR